MKYPTAIILCLLSSTVVASENETYCDFTQQQAEAEKILLASPTLIASVGRNSSTLTTIEAVGASESLSHYLKSRVQSDIGISTCELYKVATDLTKHVTYDGVAIRNSVVSRKTDAIKDAIAKIDQLADDEKQRVAAGSSTVITLELLESTRAKLNGDLFELLSQNNPIAIPTLSPVPVDELIVRTNSMLAQQQQFVAKAGKYDNWDVSLGIGGGSEAVGGSRTIRPYATLSFSYSLGAAARNRALDKSTQAYSHLLSEQTAGPIQLAYLLKSKIQEMVQFNGKALESANRYDQTIKRNLDSLNGLNTSDAHRFKVQLTLDQINNDIQIDALHASSNILTQYLQRNFNHE